MGRDAEVTAACYQRRDRRDYRALFISIALRTLDGIYASLNYDA